MKYWHPDGLYAACVVTFKPWLSIPYGGKPTGRKNRIRSCDTQLCRTSTTRSAERAITMHPKETASAVLVTDCVRDITSSPVKEAFDLKTAVR
jgi:hypothetical protein